MFIRFSSFSKLFCKCKLWMGIFFKYLSGSSVGWWMFNFYCSKMIKGTGRLNNRHVNPNPTFIISSYNWIKFTNKMQTLTENMGIFCMYQKYARINKVDNFKPIFKCKRNNEINIKYKYVQWLFIYVINLYVVFFWL